MRTFCVTSIITSLVLMFGLTLYIDEDASPSIPTVVRLTYGPLHRATWALIVSWVIYACYCGHGGN